MRLLALLLSATVAFAGTELTAFRGHVHLVAAKSPYLVNRSLVLSTTDTLTVEPGVEIRVNGYYKLMLRGAINILGTEKKPVRILAEDSTANWVGLHLSTGENLVQIQGLEVRNAFRNTFSAVRGELRKSTFEGNYYALWVEDSPSLLITECSITHNRYGITVGSDSLQVSKSSLVSNVIGVWLEGQGKIASSENTLGQNTESDISTPNDPARQGIASRYSRRTLQTVESRF